MKKSVVLRLITVYVILLLLSGCTGSQVDNITLRDCGFELTEEQYLVPENEIIVNYRVTPAGTGYISGLASQSLIKGERTAAVTAVPAPGYKFVKWSDGEKDAVRHPEKIKTDTEICAVFEEDYDTCPVLYINTENEKKLVSDEIYINITLTVDNVENRYRLNSVSGQAKCRGNASMTWNKKSFTIHLDEKTRLCGLGEGKSKNWVLISNHCDQSLLRNYIAFWLQGKLKGITWSPSCIMTEVYVNDSYQGSYMLIEKVTSAENRIDIQNYDAAGEIDADFLVEMDNYAYKAGDKGLVWFTAKSIPYEIRGEDNHSSERCDYVDKWVTDAYVTVSDGNENEIRKIIDIDSCVDSYILAEITKNIDCGWSSFFLYRKNGLLHLGPSWDFDLAMGNDERLDNASWKGLYAGEYNGFTQQNNWYLRLMECEWFVDIMLDRWDELYASGLFDDMIKEIDSAFGRYSDSFERNFEKWNIFGQRMNQEPAAVLSIHSAEGQVEYLKDWLVNRIQWLNDCYSKMR